MYLVFNDFCRRHYTSSERVVPGFQNSRSNLSQASLNRDMLRMLELSPGMTVADLGSGCGITANTFAVFGASRVVGLEVRLAVKVVSLAR